VVDAYETGLQRLTRELIDILNIWARFIYGPLLEDRVRSLPTGQARRIRTPEAFASIGRSRRRDRDGAA